MHVAGSVGCAVIEVLLARYLVSGSETALEAFWWSSEVEDWNVIGEKGAGVLALRGLRDLRDGALLSPLGPRAGFGNEDDLLVVELVVADLGVRLERDQV